MTNKLAVTEYRVSEDDFETIIVEETETDKIIRTIATIHVPEYAEKFIEANDYAALIADIREAALNTAKFITDGRGLWSEHSTQERMQAAA